VFETYAVCYICVLYMLYTSILCRVVRFDSILYLDMGGSSRDMTQLDSDETQPPEVPLNSSDSLLSRRRLVLGTKDWYVMYNTLLQHITSKGLTLFVYLKHTGLAFETSFASYPRQTHYKEPFTCWRDAPDDHKKIMLSKQPGKNKREAHKLISKLATFLNKINH